MSREQPYSELEVVTLIRTTLLRRGSGQTREDPIRCIEQWYDMRGNLLMEYDPHTDETTRFTVVYEQ